MVAHWEKGNHGQPHNAKLEDVLKGLQGLTPHMMTTSHLGTAASVLD